MLIKIYSIFADFHYKTGTQFMLLNSEKVLLQSVVSERVMYWCRNWIDNGIPMSGCAGFQAG